MNEPSEAMGFALRPLRPADAQTIDQWRYPEPYHFYNLEQDPADRAEFLDAANWPGRYFAVAGNGGALRGDKKGRTRPSLATSGLRRSDHLAGNDRFVELFGGEVAELERRFLQGEAFFVGQLGNFGRFVVADARVERRDQHQTLAD